MRTILITFHLLLFSFHLSAQENSIRVNIDHIALSVKDADQSTEFYKMVLGLKEITNRTEMEGIRWLALGEGKELHLISLLKDKVKVNKAVHFAISVNNFELFIQKLEANNIAYSDWPGTKQKVNLRADGIKQVFFQDIDGYWIEVNSVAEKK